MPEQLQYSEVSSKTDPSVAKQYDDKTDKVKQIQEFFSLADDKKIGILNTYRNGVGGSLFPMQILVPTSSNIVQAQLAALWPPPAVTVLTSSSLPTATAASSLIWNLTKKSRLPSKIAKLRTGYQYQV